MKLRYYLENWFNYIMGWTKYFFISDLYYWHWGDLLGYHSLKQKLDMLLLEAGNNLHLRKAVYEDIVERLEYEAVEMCKAETDKSWVDKMEIIWAEELPDVEKIKGRLHKETRY